MPFDFKKAAHHILRNLVIKEVSSVTRGAGEGVKVMLSKKATKLSKSAEAYLKRTFTEDERKKAEASGAAMAGGGYPIENVSDLKNAVEAFGRAKDKAATKKHIITRAKALGAEGELPDKWKVEKALFLKAIEAPIAKLFPELGADGSVLAAAIAKDVGDGDPEEAVLFDDALAAKEVTQEFQQEFWEATETLRISIASILCDDDADKEKLIGETLAQFADHLKGIMPDEMKKALAAGNAENTDGVQKMEAIKKLLGLPATASEADVLKAMEEKEKKDKAEGGKDKVEKMSDKHSAFMSNKKATMPKGGKDAFQNMSAADRDKHMSDNPIEDDDESVEKINKAITAGNAFRAEDGTVLTKADFPTENGFNFAKGQAAKIATQAADILKRDEAAAVADFTKRATDMGFAADFGETLRKAFKGDAVSIGKLETEIKAMREQIRVGKLFGEQGSNSQTGGKGYDQLMAKAAELMKVEKGLTIEQAFAKVYETPAAYGMADAVQLYKSELGRTAA
jgi:hypothetical protein